MATMIPIREQVLAPNLEIGHGRWAVTLPVAEMKGPMAKPRNETTSARAASAAGKVLRDPRASVAAKTAAASALTQVRDKGQ